MSSTGGEHATSVTWACAECKPCNFCVKAERPCFYEPRPVRTPLTRKQVSFPSPLLTDRNLDAVEDRCRKLESILRILNPNIDIETLTQIEPEEAGETLSADSSGGTPSDQESDANPERDGYEWHEGPLEDGSSLSDGMALLNIKTPDGGYIGTRSWNTLLTSGNSSGSSLLKVVHTLMRKQGISPPNEPADVVANQTFNPSFDLRDPFSSAMIVDHLLDAYFTFYNKSYPIIHENTFRETFRSMSHVPDESSWHFLFYTVLAVGAYASNTGSNYNDSPFYQAARARMSTKLLESGTLTGVQAFLLMGNYLQKRDRPNTGYNLIGIALRMALGLGLHREVSKKRNTLAQEIRRRVWWVLYMFDSGLSITMGRPVSIHETGISTRMPLNIDDSFFTLDMMSASALPAQAETPTTYSAMIAQAKLAIIANSIYNTFLANSSEASKKERESVTQMEEKLAQWRNSLPAYFTDPNVPEWFTGPRAVLLWKEQNLRLMMYKGFLTASVTNSGGSRKSLGTENAAKNCLRVAVDIVNSISSFTLAMAEIPQSISWYATYFLFQAVLLLEVARLRSPSDSLVSSWTETRDHGRTALTHIGRGNNAALRCLAVLDRLLEANSDADTPKGNQLNSLVWSLGAQPDSQYSPEDFQYMADPALQVFLDTAGSSSMLEIVEGVSSQENQRFDYLPGSQMNLGEFNEAMWDSTNWNIQ